MKNKNKSWGVGLCSMRGELLCWGAKLSYAKGSKGPSTLEACLSDIVFVARFQQIHVHLRMKENEVQRHRSFDADDIAALLGVQDAARDSLWNTVSRSIVQH